MEEASNSMQWFWKSNFRNFRHLCDCTQPCEKSTFCPPNQEGKWKKCQGKWLWVGKCRALSPLCLIWNFLLNFTYIKKERPNLTLSTVALVQSPHTNDEWSVILHICFYSIPHFMLKMSSKSQSSSTEIHLLAWTVNFTMSSSGMSNASTGPADVCKDLTPRLQQKPFYLMCISKQLRLYTVYLF